jgi:hypothetical protein
MRITYAVVVLPLLSVAVPVACAGSPQTLGFLPDASTGSSGDAAPSADSPPAFTDGAWDSGSTCSTQCSADLHQILTCGTPPQVVQTCTGDTGCGPSGCIPACEAAAANKSTIGCDYYAVPPDVWNSASWANSGAEPGNCFAAFVTNNWSTPMKVSLVWKGNTIDALPFAYTFQQSGSSTTYTPVPSSGIPANSMAIVFLNQTHDDPGGGIKSLCPAGVTAAVETEDVVLHGTNIGNAMEIQTSVPAVVYDIYPYGGAHTGIPSATLLLPTTVWDTNYVAATMAETPSRALDGPESEDWPPGIDLVAQQDGTTVTLLPTTDITAGGQVAGATKGTPITYNINKGQTIHIMQFVDGSGNDLSGSVVQSNHPIGVWGEHYCLTESATPPTWRILGMVDGTTLTYDPPNASAPQTIKKGQLVEFDGPEAFRVQSQDAAHPFYLAAHRPGMDCDAGHQQIPPIQSLGSEYVAVANESSGYSLGGPETVNVVPPAQFLKNYLFFTDPTYGYTDLALVRVKAADNTFKDVKLDCLGTVGGWQPVGSSGLYEYVHVDLRHSGQPVGNCDNGVRTLSSDERVGITVWGYDGAGSYAYPAGASVKPINTVVVVPTQ